MDKYDELAKKFGATDTPAADAGVDYDSLAASMGGKDARASEPAKPVKIGKDAFADDLRSTLRETDWATRNIAGAGTALSDVYQGAKQLIGMGDRDAIEANEIIADEAPVGAIAGNAALTAVPFAMAGNTLKGAAVAGGASGFARPVGGEQTAENIIKGKAVNTAVGGVMGAAGQALANKATDMVAKKASDMASRKAQNAVLDETLNESIKAGYKVPPSMMPDSGKASRLAEGLSGDVKTKQLAGIANQRVSNTLARKALGLPENAPLSIPNIEKVRKAAYQPYQEIAALPQTRTSVKYALPKVVTNPKADLEALKQARNDSTSWFNAYNRSASPDDLAKAKAALTAAENLESKIESHAFAAGRADLVPALRDARKMIAKTYTVERALKKGSGNIDAKVLGRLFEKQKPLSDGLDTIGKFGATFGDVAGVPKSGNANPFTDWTL